MKCWRTISPLPLLCLNPAPSSLPQSHRRSLFSASISTPPLTSPSFFHHLPSIPIAIPSPSCSSSVAFAVGIQGEAEHLVCAGGRRQEEKKKPQWARDSAVLASLLASSFHHHSRPPLSSPSPPHCRDPKRERWEATTVVAVRQSRRRRTAAVHHRFRHRRLQPLPPSSPSIDISGVEVLISGFSDL